MATSQNATLFGLHVLAQPAHACTYALGSNVNERVAVAAFRCLRIDVFVTVTVSLILAALQLLDIIPPQAIAKRYLLLQLHDLMVFFSNM